MTSFRKKTAASVLPFGLNGLAVKAERRCQAASIVAQIGQNRAAIQPERRDGA